MNLLILDQAILLLDHICKSWGRYCIKDEIIASYKSSGFYWIFCKEDIIPSIKAIIGKFTLKIHRIYDYIGMPTAWTGIGYNDVYDETQLLFTEKELRSVVNGLYETIQSQKESKMFDIMLLREIRSQLFWNWVFYFMNNNLPYDWLLPYAELDAKISSFSGTRVSLDIDYDDY